MTVRETIELLAKNTDWDAELKVRPADSEEEGFGIKRISSTLSSGAFIEYTEEN